MTSVYYVLYMYGKIWKVGSTHNVRTVGVVKLAGAAAIAGQHLGHVLSFILRETHEADASAGKHF